MFSFNHCLRKLKTSVLDILPYKSFLLTPNYSHYYPLNYFKSQGNEVSKPSESSVSGVVSPEYERKNLLSFLLHFSIYAIQKSHQCFTARPHFKQIPNLLSIRTPKYLHGFQVFHIFFLYFKKVLGFIPSFSLDPTPLPYN